MEAGFPVEFGVYRTPTGEWSCYKLSCRGGAKVSRARVEAIRLEERDGKAAARSAAAGADVCPPASDIDEGEVSDDCEFVHDRTHRFTGVVTSYDVAKGVGYVQLEDGYEAVERVVSRRRVSGELRLVRRQILAEGEISHLARGFTMEFGIYCTPAGVWKCYKVTIPGGGRVSQREVNAFCSDRDAAEQARIDSSFPPAGGQEAGW
jgi:hypothetical protein